MDASDAVHPTDQMLQSYGMGKLDEHLFQKVSRHVDACLPCRERVTELSSDTFPDKLRAVGGPSNEAGDGGPQKGRTPERARAESSGSESPASSSPGLPAELVDNPDYEIIRELGRGGMGVVYLVYNRLMGRHEAIKIIGRELMERQIVLDRFLREIRSVARLRHPNVVAAYSATRMGESIVYAMEYVDGLDLARLVKSKGPLPVAHACYFTHQVALGLQHAHEQGIVHRDIKPGNLIFSRTGGRPIVKILDFGLNKAASEDGIDTSLTRQGQMLGTPDYIAPEQTLDAQSVDIRADIYSLGCTLYYLLSGRPPFRGGSLFEVLQAHHSTEATALDLLRPEVPAELAGIVARMMAKEREKRFQTPADVAQALAPLTRKGYVTTRPTAREIPVSVPASPAPASAAAGTQSAQEGSRGGGVPIKEPEGPPGARSQSSWDQLINLGEPDRLAVATPGQSKSAASHRWMWPAAVAATIVLSVAAVWGVVSFKATTAKREVVDRPTMGVESPIPSAVPVAVREIAASNTTKPAPPLERQAPPADVPQPKPAHQSGSTIRDGDGAVAAVVKNVQPEIKAVKATDKNVLRKVVVDIRRIASRAGALNLADAGAVLPVLDFWPLLTPENLTAWQVADPTAIKMNAVGVVLDAGEGGNYLLTRQADFKVCKIFASISAAAGTSAWLVLRAHDGPDGWLAVTSRVEERARKVRAGMLSLDFQGPDRGKVRDDFEPEKFFNVVFKIDARNVARVLVNGKETVLENQASTRAGGYAGASGVFVKSGRLVIKALRVSDSD